MIEKMNNDKLAQAIREHDVEQLKKRLDEGAAPDEYTDKDNYFTPLIDAIDELDDNGPIEAVQLLIAAGAEVNRWNNQGDLNPLLAAMAPGRDHVFPLLLEAGGNPDIQNDEGMTPLRWAAENNLLDTMEKMLKTGVPDTLHKPDPATGRNPLGIAVQAQNREMTKLLLAHGANAQLPDLDYRVALAYLPEDLSESDRRKWEELLQNTSR